MVQFIVALIVGRTCLQCCTNSPLCQDVSFVVLCFLCLLNHPLVLEHPLLFGRSRPVDRPWTVKTDGF